MMAIRGTRLGGARLGVGEIIRRLGHDLVNIILPSIKLRYAFAYSQKKKNPNQTQRNAEGSNMDIFFFFVIS